MTDPKQAIARVRAALTSADHYGLVTVAGIEADDLRALLALAAPPPEVVEAAERLLELAGRATEGPWIVMDAPQGSPDGPCVAGGHVTVCDTLTNAPESRADAAFIAAARTLAPVVAGWVKEPRR